MRFALRNDRRTNGTRSFHCRRCGANIEQILAPQGAIALTAQGPFTARLILSNEDWFKYKIVWKIEADELPQRQKTAAPQARGHLRLLPAPADLSAPDGRRRGLRQRGPQNQLTGSYGDFRPAHIKSEGGRYPTDVIYHKTAESEGQVYHATQKPVGLGRYLIRTYTKPGDVVLDNAFGSGSFVVAAAMEGRHAIGIELNQEVEAFRAGAFGSDRRRRPAAEAGSGLSGGDIPRNVTRRSRGVRPMGDRQSSR